MEHFQHYEKHQIKNPCCSTSKVIAFAIPEGDSAFLGYSIYQPNIEARKQIESGAVTVAYNIMRCLAGTNWCPTSVSFVQRKPADIRPYQQFFKAPLKFDAERNGVCFNSKWLSQPVPGAGAEPHR